MSIIPDEKKFNIRANFLTWQPSIYNGIRYIAQGIADHSNFNGEPLVNLNEKKILIEVVKMKSENLNFIEFMLVSYLHKKNKKTFYTYHTDRPK